MTFDELVSDTAIRLNMTSTDAITRIGRSINRLYRSASSSIGLNVTRQIEVTENTTIDNPEITFSGLEQTADVIDKRTGRNHVLTQVSTETLRRSGSIQTQLRCYAVTAIGADSVTILMDSTPTAVFPLYANGYGPLADLTADDVPAFPADFHDLLIEGVLVDEYMKLEKPDLANISKSRYDQRLSDLRFFLQKSATLSLIPRTRRAGWGRRPW